MNNKWIEKLLPNQIFVFGSNEAGKHGAGAALLARKKFGAQYGVARGLQGFSYAIPTKDHLLKPLKLSTIKVYVDIFLLEAVDKYPDLDFLVTPIGTGLAGHSLEDIDKMFPENEKLPNNITLIWRNHNHAGN